MRVWVDSTCVYTQGDSTVVNSLVTLMITRESGSCRARLIGGGGQPSLVGDTQQIGMEIICHENI